MINRLKFYGLQLGDPCPYPYPYPWGTTAGRTDDAYSKLNEQETATEPPAPHPGRKGGVEGGEQAEEGARAGLSITPSTDEHGHWI